ncbi:MAG: UPF0149 family protein [Pseudomonadales bacterium]
MTSTPNIPDAVPADFDELADCLLGIGAHFSPSELHGAVVGALAGAMRLGREQWAAFALAVCGADGGAGSPARSAAVFGGLAERELALLAGPELSFRLFLPDDEYDIAQRTESLASWCKGFLGGFAEARSYCAGAGAGVGIGVGVMENDHGGQELPESVLESLQDMAAIAQASVNALDDDNADEDDLFAIDPIKVTAPSRESEGEPANHEMAERDYTEISEYLRLAALTVFTEYGWVEKRGNETVGDVRTLH